MNARQSIAWSNKRNLFLGIIAVLIIGIGILLTEPSTPIAQASIPPTSPNHQTDLRATGAITSYLYLPFVARPSACPVLTETYGTVTPMPPPTDRPAEQHADLNLALRGYTPTSAYLGLIDLDGHTDLNAPQLPGLFSDNRTGVFTTTYRVYNWDWNCNCKTTPISDPPVTLAGLVTTPTETIRVPGSGYDIGRLPNGFEVMVLYASTDRITLKYTREDNVVNGYTLHLENICVDPNLLALYQSLNASGRTQLPALYAGQGVGTAKGNWIGVAIRDTGQFMDPRSRKDWWQGR